MRQAVPYSYGRKKETLQTVSAATRALLLLSPEHELGTAEEGFGEASHAFKFKAASCSDLKPAGVPI
jgi:hypothetical protein